MLYSVGLCTGLRIADLLALNKYHVRQWIKNGWADVWIHKTRKYQRVIMDKDKSMELSVYMIANGVGNMLFYSSSNCKWRAATRQHVVRVFKAASGLCGLQGITPHSMRRTCAIDLYRSGASITEVQHKLGHDRPQTTAIYLLERGVTV